MELTEEQLQFFDREGYLVVDGIFDDATDFVPLRGEITAQIDQCARDLQRQGKISDLHENQPFSRRLAALVDDHPDLTPDYMRCIEGKAGGGFATEAMFRVLTHPRLLDLVQGIVGPEIIGSSVYRVRPKLPGHHRGVVPWHQDSGYFSAHCDTRLIVTCWVPMVDATEHNGCLQVIPRRHRDGVYRHHTGGNAGFLVITDDDLPPAEPVTVPVSLGSVLLLTNLTPHQSLWNHSSEIRWSVDLRYQSADVPTNAFAEPQDFDESNLVTMACYPPEGDFVVRSKRAPNSQLTYEQFSARRRMFEEATIPFPSRGWEPVAG